MKLAIIAAAALTVAFVHAVVGGQVS